MLNYLRNEQKYILRLLSILILSLLALKTGNLLFSIFPNQYQLISKTTLDNVDETEVEDHKEIEKPYSKLNCLIDDEKGLTLSEQLLTTKKTERRFKLSLTENFGRIPSPPPDATRA